MAEYVVELEVVTTYVARIEAESAEDAEDEAMNNYSAYMPDIEDARVVYTSIE